MVIGFNERFFCVFIYVPFESFGQIRHRNLADFRPKRPKVVIFKNMSIFETFSTPSNRGAVEAFSCFTYASLLSFHIACFSFSNAYTIESSILQSFFKLSIFLFHLCYTVIEITWMAVFFFFNICLHLVDIMNTQLNTHITFFIQN